MKKLLIILFLSGCAIRWDVQPKPVLKIVELQPIKNIHCEERLSRCPYDE